MNLLNEMKIMDFLILKDLKMALDLINNLAENYMVIKMIFDPYLLKRQRRLLLRLPFVVFEHQLVSVQFFDELLDPYV